MKTALFTLLTMCSPVAFVAVPACNKTESVHGQSVKTTPQAVAPASGQVSAAQLLERAKPVFGQLPIQVDNPQNPLTPAKIELGQILYHDPRLSKNQDVACVTCHSLEQFGVDVREAESVRHKTSLGHRGQFGDRNTPTVYNAALHFVQFWDGRARDLEQQAEGPILNPVEMAMPDQATVVKVVKSIPGYKDKFKAAFPGDGDPITYANIVKALGAFERILITPSPFDAFLAGNVAALNQDQLRGLQLFMDVGCTTCHTGPGIGGSMYQKLGHVKPYATKDEGRFKLTKNEADKFVFKVPSLRNVHKTAPYFHDGSIETLDRAVKVMAEHQLAKGALTDDEAKHLLAFLDSLTGELPKVALVKPELPPNGPRTPGPDPS